MSSDNLLLSKYLNQYRKDPKSKVFAPLAETYRKLGLVDEAVKTLLNGLRFHRNYQLAYIVLGHCYYDQENYEAAYKTLKPYLESNYDNIMLQRIFSKVCLELNYNSEALDAFKYLLFLDPLNIEVQEKVEELEKTAEITNELSVVKDLDVSNKSNDWVTVDLNTDSENLQQVDDFDSWEMEKLGTQKLNELPEKKETDSLFDSMTLSDFDGLDVPDEISSGDIDNSTEVLPEIIPEEINANFEVTKSEYENNNDDDASIPDVIDDEISSSSEHRNMDEVEKLLMKGESEPLVTHTMVDIYIAQKHFSKAREILEQILEKYPDDKKSQNKLREVLRKTNLEAPKKKETQQSESLRKYKLIETHYFKFLNEIKDMSRIYASR